MKKLYIAAGIIVGIIIASAGLAHAATVLFPTGGGTGTSTIPILGQVLVGQSNGTYAPQATSTLGLAGGASGGTGTISTSTLETSGYFPTWATTAGSPALIAGTSSLFQLGGKIGVATTTPSGTLSVVGTVGINTDTTPAAPLEVNVTPTPNTTSIGQYITNKTTGNLAGAILRLGYAASVASTAGISGYFFNVPSGPALDLVLGAVRAATLNNTGFGIGSTSPSARLAVHDNSGGIASSTLEFSIASSTAAGTGTTTLFTVDGFGSTTIKGSVGIAGGLMNDNNGRVNLGIGISGVNKAKCGLAVLDNFAAGCAQQNGAFVGANISNDTNYNGYSAGVFQKGSNVNSVNSAGSNSVVYVGQGNTATGTSAGVWSQTGTVNANTNSTAYGYVSNNYIQGTGQLTNYIGYDSQGQYATAGPTVTNHYDFRADPFGTLTNGTTTTRYGLYLGYDSTSITNPFGIFQLSPTVKNYLAGNLGLGSTSPVARLSIVGGVGSTTDLFVIASSSNTQLLTVNSNGNLGVGVPLPLFPVTVTTADGTTGITIAGNGGSAGSGGGLEFNYNAANLAGNNRIARILGNTESGGGGGLLFQTASAGNAAFATKVSLTRAGNFGVGTTTPVAKLDVYGTAGTADIFAISSSSNARLLTVTSAGNVGIGTSTPGFPLVVTGTTTSPCFSSDNGATCISGSGGSGTVTSVGLTAPIGLSVSGSPVTTSGTLALSLTAGYVIPLTASTTDWQTAFSNRITSLTNTGTGVATLAANVLNIPLYAATTTSNTWASTQTFTNAPIFSSLTGILKGNGASALTVAANGTDYTLVSAQTCTNQVITALTASGGSTCSTVSNAMLANSTISGVALGGTLGALTATNSTLTFSGSYTGAAAQTIGINLANANTWTGITVFTATSTQATTSISQLGIGTTSTAYKLDLDGGTGNIFRILANATTAIVNVVGSTLTGLGTWDLSGATVKIHTYPAFTYATSTAWTTGTTTIPLGPAYVAETWTGVKCFTDAGTVLVSFYDGTNRMNPIQASTTVQANTLSTNNTFAANTKRYVDIGTPSGTTQKVSCTVDKIVNQ